MTTGRIPITILTGFLGAGKTSLLNRLLKDPSAGRLAIVINEFGEIGLDHDLIETSRDDITLLAGGCLCCRVRGDLIRALRDLFFRRAKGEVTEFDRVVIETSGLADPAPILQTLMTDPVLTEHYRMDGLVTLIDGALGSVTLDRQPEALAQAVIADRILIGKQDMATASAIADLETRLHDLNPSAKISRLPPDGPVAGLVYHNGMWNQLLQKPDPVPWLNAGGFDALDGHVCGPECRHAPLPGLMIAESPRHDAGIGSACLTFEAALKPNDLLAFIDRLIDHYGPDLLRVKGLVAIEGLDGPMVMHGVQHIFHPPVRLPAWPSPDHRSRLVVIGRGVTADNLANLLGSVANPPDQEIIRL